MKSLVRKGIGMKTNLSPAGIIESKSAAAHMAWAKSWAGGIHIVNSSHRL